MGKDKKKWMITKLFEKFIWSFDNTSSGFSARKLSSFAAVCVAMYITIHYASSENLQNILSIWLIFALLCLGIITAEQVLRFKEGNEIGKNPEDDHETQVETEETVKTEKTETIDESQLSDEEAMAQIVAARTAAKHDQ